MGYHIEKSSIQETQVFPLYARSLCTRQSPHLFSDPLSVALPEQSDRGSLASKQTSGSLMQTFGAMEAAMEQRDPTWAVGTSLHGTISGRLVFDAAQPAVAGLPVIGKTDDKKPPAADPSTVFPTRSNQDTRNRGQENTDLQRAPSLPFSPALPLPVLGKAGRT